MWSDARFLKARHRPVNPALDSLAAVDLFAGCGGLSLGFSEAARRADLRLRVHLAVDFDPVMAATYLRNLPGSVAVAARVEDMFPGEPGAALSAIEGRIVRSIGNVDVLLGGPPCQGHSDLNNHTRRQDDRNRLYLRMARAAEVLKPAVVLVENVPAVQRDVRKVVDETILQLEKIGYTVGAEVIDLSVVGVPQHRRRHLLLATRLPNLDPATTFDQVKSFDTPRSIEWAIADLVGRASSSALVDSSSVATAVNKRRMKYLFDHNLYDLPDSERPPCHREKEHSYRSVYGRMQWDLPAPTITTGFGSMGQGRYVHPSEQRTITPHEAARIQTFPDWFDWGANTRRGRLATMIGNAVPPLLTVRMGEFLIPHLRRE